MDVTFFIFFLTSCKGHTEAWKRLVIGKLPATICLQLLRFSSNGKKFQHIVKYDEMLKLCEMRISDDSGSTEITRVSYKLVAVVVHIGNKLSSGHYVCYMKRNGLWYNADDAHVKECTPFERDVSDDPVVEMTQGLSSFAPHTFVKHHPLTLDKKETIHIKKTTFFYAQEPWCDVRTPAVCRTAQGCPGLQYIPICESEQEQAELLVTLRHTIPHHSRTQG